MKQKARTTWFILGLALLILFSSCTSESNFKGKIGMTCMDLTNPFFKLIGNVMQEEAAKYGYEVVALSGGLDPAKQNNQLSDFVAQEYDAIFLNPVDSKSAGEGVKKAYAVGIPVFTFDVQVTDERTNRDVVRLLLGRRANDGEPSRRHDVR